MDWQPKQVPNVTDLIEAVMPRDKPFTISTVVYLLQVAHQGQAFHYPIIRTQASRLCSRGSLKRLRKTSMQESIYVFADSALEGESVATKSLADVTTMVAIFVCWYNFSRVHEIIKSSPAMAAGLTEHKWMIKEMVGVAGKA